MKMCLESQGKVLGQEDVMSARNYTSTVKCASSEGTVYCMKAEEFNFRMRKDEKTWTTL